MIFPLALLALNLNAQQPVRCAPRDTYCAEITAVAADARVRRAVSYLEQSDAAAVRELIALTQIPAPPFKESERARRYAELMRAAGADSVYIDEIGNVVSLRRGLTRGRTVVVAGHMDTVFPEGTDVRVRQRGDTLFAPGIGDNTRGLIALLQIMRSLVTANIRSASDILIVGTVGEEGLGDLRGSRHLLRNGGPRIDTFIAVDGASDDALTTTAVGSRRYRVTFTGPGGHSYGSFGNANAIHALSRAIYTFDESAARYTALGTSTTYNVGRIAGGTSINAIAEQAWAEIDMRSESPVQLAAIDSILHSAMLKALNEQNDRRTRGAELTMEIKLVGERPPGTTPPPTPVVQRAMAATRYLGLTPRLEASSTDANVAISRGIPALTIGRGGQSGNSHSTAEWWLNSNGTRGIRRILYTLLAEAGLPAR